MASSEPEPKGSALLGRERECAAIDGALAAVYEGESTVLVLRGDPGIGKSTLLRYAAGRATGSTVLRTSGLEAESDLAFSGLLGLLRPILSYLDSLPDSQSAALAGALGIADSRHADRFLVSAATLGLLAAAADERPVVALVDDAQWLDPPSADALLFSARRLAADRVAMLVAVRDGESSGFVGSGLADLALDGLTGEAADLLLDVSAPGADRGARKWLLSQAGGNPLALLELPAGLSDAQLAGRAALPAVVPLTERLQLAFGGRLDALPEATRTALLIAAVDDLGDAGTVVRATVGAGWPEDALDPAERSGLVQVAGGQLAFRHPLIRTAVRSSATLSQLRHAHAALASALTGDEQTDRRLWHEALASIAPDPGLATALEEAAIRARTRAAHGSAATTFRRAADLSVENELRLRRTLAGAQAAWAAGDPDQSRAAIATALPVATGRTRAELLQLQGVIEARTGDVHSAISILLESAAAADSDSFVLELMMEAAEAAIYAGDYARVVEIGARTAAIAPEAAADRFRQNALGGLAATFTGDFEKAASLLAAAIEGAKLLDDVDSLVWAARLTTLTTTHGDGLIAAGRAVAVARERALLSLLPIALQEQSTALVGHGQFSLAYAAAEEAVRLSRDFGQQWGARWSLANMATIEALRGHEQRAREHAEAALELAASSGAAFISAFANRALALLDLTLGRSSAATDRLLELTADDVAYPNPVIALLSIPDLLEAAARAGRLLEVADRLQRYGDWSARSPSEARSALLARCRAVAGSGEEQTEFERAIALGRALSPFQQGRTELLYGEWLRRRRESRAARPHLRRAAEAFRLLGMAPWQQRAEAELRATGEASQSLDASALDDLTAQEFQIARLVAAGMTNRQIAGQLFLSPRTIDYHLRKIFVKLGLTSRTELLRLMAVQSPSA